VDAEIFEERLPLRELPQLGLCCSERRWHEDARVALDGGKVLLFRFLGVGEVGIRTAPHRLLVLPADHANRALGSEPELLHEPQSLHGRDGCRCLLRAGPHTIMNLGPFSPPSFPYVPTCIPLGP